MTMQGHVRNGVVVLDESMTIPEGTLVRVETVEVPQENTQKATPRLGGQYAGRIWMAADFDQWPVDIQEALGMIP